MLSRIPSNASSQPRRSKSIPSIKRPQLKHAKSFNTSELAHREALTAAELAFERARERYASANGLEYRGTTDTAHPTLKSYNPQLVKNQSVRFTGSHAVKSRELPNTRREVSDHTGASGFKNTAPGPEYVETVAASEPSSYRRLRKAKSMFSSNQPPSDLFIDGTHTCKGHFKRESMRSSESQNTSPWLPDRHLRRSFSFLRGVTDRLSISNQKYATHDAAIQIARDQYLRQLEEQRLMEQSSFLDLARKRKLPKNFRRTVRTSSTSSQATLLHSPLLAIDQGKENSISHKARNVSQTLKKTFKRVFGRSLPDVPKLPEQHLSATKAHYGERFDDHSEHHYPPIPSPDIGLLRRVDSRESVLRDVTGHKEYKAPTGSLRSLTTADKNSNQQSRVTSWTNSTAANTVDMPQFVEHKRLSIIKEDGGPHQPSSSAARYMNPSDRYAVFRQPVRLDDTGPTHAARVYSALQKEIHKSGQIAVVDGSDIGSDSSSDQSTSRPANDTFRRISSNHALSNGQAIAIPQTYGLPASQSVPFTFSPTTMVDGPFSRPHQGISRLPDFEHRYIEPGERLTPQQIAHLNESELPSPKKPLREVKSAFFPSESRIERRTTSPYRRALYDSSEDRPHAREPNIHTSPNAWLASPRTMASVRNTSTTVSESVYSRTEGGHSPRAIGSSVSLPKTDSSGEPGTAVIVNSRLQSPSLSVHPSSPWRQASNQSSGEWKRWMASEVSFFEDPVPRTDGFYNALPVKESGHKRENAQWDGDEMIVGKVATPTHAINQPLGTLQTKTNARPALLETMSRSNVGKSPLHLIKTCENEKVRMQKENNPEMLSQRPSHKYLATKGEDMDTISSATALTGIRTKPSQMALSSCNEIESSATSANSPNSPEWAGRLQKLQNRSSQSFDKADISPRNDPLANETQATHISPSSSPCMLNQAEPSFSNSSSHLASRQALIGTFLKSRRSQMRVSDESGGDHAFL